MFILVVSHLSFSISVSVRNIEVNEKLFFATPSTNVAQFCPKSDHMIFVPSRTETNRFFIFTTIPKKYLSKVDCACAC